MMLAGMDFPKTLRYSFCAIWPATLEAGEIFDSRCESVYAGKDDRARNPATGVAAQR